MDQPKARVIAAVGLLDDFAKCDLFDLPANPAAAVADDAFLVRQMQKCLLPQDRNKWALIESIVVFDEIAYDSFAFNRFPMTATQRERLGVLEGRGLRSMVWPKEVYQQTGERLYEWRKAIRANGLEASAREVPREPSRPGGAGNDAYWDGQEKSYHDGLFEDGERRLWSFAESNESFERAFFCAELCKELGVGMAPRPRLVNADAAAWSSALDDLSSSYGQCIHHFYTQKLLKPFDRQIPPAKLAVSFPPLAQKIAWLSLKTGRTPTDLALEMRELENATAYRRHLGDLQHELRAERSSPSAIPALLKDFAAIVERWAEERNPYAYVKYRPRKLSVHLLPAAASIAAYLFGDHTLHEAADTAALAEVVVPFLPPSVTVRDPILWGGPKYLEFVSDWYNYDSVP
jgi:hypothetical protein